jgi:hypothetical protein
MAKKEPVQFDTLEEAKQAFGQEENVYYKCSVCGKNHNSAKSRSQESCLSNIAPWVGNLFCYFPHIYLELVSPKNMFLLALRSREVAIEELRNQEKVAQKNFKPEEQFKKSIAALEEAKKQYKSGILKL